LSGIHENVGVPLTAVNWSATRRGGLAGLAGYGKSHVSSSPEPPFRLSSMCRPSGENLSQGVLRMLRDANGAGSYGVQAVPIGELT
jgi:hypothetical protein